MKGEIDFDLLWKYQEQIIKENLSWAEINPNNKEHLKVFEAGLICGMRSLITTLKLHNILTVKTKGE